MIEKRKESLRDEERPRMHDARGEIDRGSSEVDREERKIRNIDVGKFTMMVATERKR